MAKRGRYSTDRSIGILARRLRCGTATDLRDWAKFTQREDLRVHDLFERFCGDCPLQFQLQELKAGRCLRGSVERRPRDKDEDGGSLGV